MSELKDKELEAGNTGRGVSELTRLLGLRWITKREKSGTVWQLIDVTQMTGVIIFKSHLGYVLGQEEHPTFKTLKGAKNEGIKRYEEAK